tara:strand:+ start:548 stop:769 length:222 start_codon:yes stop_codon:yes gene_type:complete
VDKSKESPGTITIEGSEYNISDFSDNAKSQLQGMSIAMNELKSIEIKKALMETARNAYAHALNDDLPEPIAKD